MVRQGYDVWFCKQTTQYTCNNELNFNYILAAHVEIRNIWDTGELNKLYASDTSEQPLLYNASMTEN